MRYWTEACEASVLAGTSIDRAMAMLEDGLFDYYYFDPETAASGSVYVPLGPWATGECTYQQRHRLHNPS